MDSEFVKLLSPALEPEKRVERNICIFILLLLFSNGALQAKGRPLLCTLSVRWWGFIKCRIWGHLQRNVELQVGLSRSDPALLTHRALPCPRGTCCSPRGTPHFTPSAPLQRITQGRFGPGCWALSRELGRGGGARRVPSPALLRRRGQSRGSGCGRAGLVAEPLPSG